MTGNAQGGCSTVERMTTVEHQLVIAPDAGVFTDDETDGCDRRGDPDGSGCSDWHRFGVDVVRSRAFDCGITMPAEGRGGWFPGTDRWSNDEFFRYAIRDVDLVV
jgi:hypothetical protein